MMFDITRVLMCFAIFINIATAQSPYTPQVTFPAENQSLILNPLATLNSISSSSSLSTGIPNIPNDSNVPNIPSIPNISSNAKRNDWWPPSEEDITHTSPYPVEINQPAPSPYYLSAQSPVLPHYRSEHWNHYDYPEYVYPVMPPNANQMQVPTKYAAIGLFIGLLTLFAIIQGSIMTAKRKDGMTDILASRRKRDLLELADVEHMTVEQQDIVNNDAKIRCIQRTICQENQLLSNDFGLVGVKLAKYLTRSVEKSLKNTPGWDRLVEDAGAAGLRGEDCSVLYRDCVLPVISKFHG